MAHDDPTDATRSWNVEAFLHDEDADIELVHQGSVRLTLSDSTFFLGSILRHSSCAPYAL